MNAQELAAVLIELRNASISLGTTPSEEAVRALYNKYDILFLGSKFNIIYSNELCHYLNTKLNVGISLETLNLAIPSVCSALGMKYQSMINASDVGKPIRPTAAYEITLF